jgi:hypothetical protein
VSLWFHPHCWWVFSLSSADGTDALRKLITHEKCRAEANRHIRALTQSHDSAWFLKITSG